MINDKKDRIYKKLEKEQVQWLEAFCITDPCRQTNDDVLKKASSNSSDEGSREVEEDEYQDMFIQEERANKIRRLTRGVHEFTAGVPLEGERRKCKGWPNDGMLAFEKYVRTIRTDVEDSKYVAWEKAIGKSWRHWAIQGRKKGAPLRKAKYKPNLGVVYEGFD